MKTVINDDFKRKLDQYIDKCFQDAFKAEERSYNKDSYYSEYILIKNKNDDQTCYQFYPIIWCKYHRVQRRVSFRLKNNLKKNFGLEFSNTDNLRTLINFRSGIDYNYTQFKVSFKDKNRKNDHLYVSIFDKYTNPYESGNLDDINSGECMLAFIYEKLLFMYWNIDAEAYNSLEDGDEKMHLPDYLREDWESFKELYQKAFGEPIGARYDIIVSSGLELL